MSVRHSSDAGTLKKLHEELAVFEQKIRDRQKENRSFDEEAAAAEELKERISILKQRIVEQGRLPGSGESPDTPTVRWNRFFADDYRKVFVGGVGGLLCLIIVIILLGRLRRRPAVSPVPVGEAAKPAPVPVSTLSASAASVKTEAGMTELRDTMEKLRNLSTRIQKGETGEMDLQGLKNGVPKAVPTSPVVKPPPPVKSATESVTSPDFPGHDNGRVGNGAEMIEKVFELSMRGASVEEISEKLRIDQDQVRLILRFKQ